MVRSDWFSLFRPPPIFATAVAIFGWFFSFFWLFSSVLSTFLVHFWRIFRAFLGLQKNALKMP